MIKKAEVKIQVRCTMDEQTSIPTNLCFSCGEPDEKNCIEYSVSGFVKKDQLQRIFLILKERGTMNCFDEAE